MMLHSIVLAAALIGAPAATPQQAVATAMADSAAGWNAGVLNRFVAIYADDAVFVTPKGLLRGKAEIADHYRPRFAKGANTRGKLSFQMLAHRKISVVHQLLFARWMLTSADGRTVDHGMTTLLFERRGDGWKIISDHSS